MDTSDLALYTSQQLIAELLRRTTFLGVIVHSENEMRASSWDVGDRTFKVQFNANLNTPQASRLLDTVAEYMDLHCEG